MWLNDSSEGTNEVRIGDAEWALRIQLAACYRLIEHFQWSSLIWTHTTLRVPGPEHHFLINPYGLRYDEVTASNLVKIDLDGNVLDGSKHEVNRAGFVIHSAIHMSREDARCVMHTHTPAGMAVAALADGLAPISLYALDFYDRIAYHDYEGPSLRLDERERLIASLGATKMQMILRNHGLLTCGRTVAEAFVRMYRLEAACRVQIAAQSTGARLVIPDKQLCAEHARRIDEFFGSDCYGENEFAAYVRMLDANGSNFRT